MIPDFLSYYTKIFVGFTKTFLYPSLKAPVCQWVSESVYLCVWMFPNYTETAASIKLKILGTILLDVEKVLG